MKYGISRASWLGIRSDMSIHGVFVSVGQHYIKPVTVFVLVQIEHYEKFHRNVTSTRHDMAENIAHLHLLTLISKISQATKRLLKFEIGVCSWKLVKKNKIKNKSTYREAIVITNLKNELRSNIQTMIKNPEVRNLYNIRKLQLLLDTL